MGIKNGSVSSHEGEKFSMISGELWEPSEVPLLDILDEYPAPVKRRGRDGPEGS